MAIYFGNTKSDAILLQYKLIFLKC